MEECVIQKDIRNYCIKKITVEESTDEIMNSIGSMNTCSKRGCSDFRSGLKFNCYKENSKKMDVSSEKIFVGTEEGFRPRVFT